MKEEEKKYLKQFFTQKKLESINLSATNGTLVTKGEFECNFLTTPTEAQIEWLHLVNTTLNQLVI